MDTSNNETTMPATKKPRRAAKIVLFGPTYRAQVRRQGGRSCNECAACGKDVGEPKFMVEFNDQGFFPLGPDCAARAKAQGFNVEEW